MQNNNPLSTVPHFASKKRVSYFYRPETANYYYAPGHPMKPQRLRLTHHLLLATGVYSKLTVMHPHSASQAEMENFHLPDYVQFIKKVSPATEQEFERQAMRFAVGRESDSPIFSGLFDFMSICAGASIDAAMQINHGDADVCVNWAGGLHHAKKAEASGFCYINDIVLCILELLKYHPRVLYVDIDIHHGDGVEEAFYTTDRVMTCSFHQTGDFFPGTGSIDDVGQGPGLHCAVNVPLWQGLDDQSFTQIFKPIMDKIMQVYQPNAVVMCCGADSICGDRLGVWNLSLHGHAMAVDYIKGFGLPLVLLGGGGYTPRNVARCWAYETAVALGVHGELRDEIPPNDFSLHFGSNPRLHIETDPSMENKNSRQYLEQTMATVLDNLNALKGAPSVPFQNVPADFISRDDMDLVRERPSSVSEGDFLNPSEGALLDE